MTSNAWENYGNGLREELGRVRGELNALNNEVDLARAGIRRLEQTIELVQREFAVHVTYHKAGEDNLAAHDQNLAYRIQLLAALIGASGGIIAMTIARWLHL